MKTFILTGLFLGLLCSSFMVSHNPKSILDLASEKYKKDIDNFNYKLVELSKLSTELKFKKKKVAEFVLKNEYKNLRVAYKNVELFVEYFDEQFVKYKLNGAPLPKLEPLVPEINILDPSGLQVLDEIIFADKVDLDAAEEKFKEIEIAWSTAFKTLKYKNIEHRYLLESIYQNLIRVYTLSLTGFDTPGSQLGIVDAYNSLNTVLEYLEFYRLLDGQENRELVNSAKRMIQECKAKLKESTFNDLDRLHILKFYFNPLMESIVLLQAKT